MTNRITELREEINAILLKNVPENGNVTHKVIQRCMLDLAHQKAELVALVSALHFLQEEDQKSHREFVNQG